MNVERSGFDRAGHLTELALNRLDEDDRADDPSFFADADAHLETCPACRDRLAAQRESDRSIDLPPAATVIARWRRPTRPRIAFIGAGLGAALAMAATLLLVTREPPDDGDAIRRKGGLHVEVHVHDGERERLVGDGDTVRPGDRVAFGVRTEREGHLLVFGWDAKGAVYPIWPSASDPLQARSQPIGKLDATLPLPAAVRFDDVSGDEHLAVVFCRDVFGLAELAPAGRLGGPPAVPQGCGLRVVVLHKAP